MNLGPLILILGFCIFHWTTAAINSEASYRISDGILKFARPINFSINLSYSGLKGLAFDCFRDAENIKSLNLSNNELSHIPLMVFTGSINLKTLSLANNKLSSISHLFYSLINLEYLDISGNQIEALKPGDLFALPKSVKINVKNTPIREISTQLYEPPDILRYRHPSSVMSERPWQEKKHDEPRFCDHYTFKVCISTDGTLESVEEAALNANVGNCMLLPKSGNICSGQIPLMNLKIKRVRSNWFRVNSTSFHYIAFWANDLSELQPELINDLPATIKTIGLSSNKITAINNNGLKNDNSISIELDSNNINRIDDDAFGKVMLDKLDLSSNRIGDLGFIRTLPVTIRSLMLYENFDIRSFESGIFENLKNLVSLDLCRNFLYQLEPASFRGLERLTTLDLSTNVLHKISRNLFENWNPLPTTELSLSLSGNSISMIENGAFSGRNLRKLDLTENNFTNDTIDEAFLAGSTISELALGGSYGQIVIPNGKWFKDISKLEKVSLESKEVQRLPLGFAQYMNSVTSLDLTYPDLKILQNGVLFGLSTDKDVRVTLSTPALEVIEGGLFSKL